MPRLQSWGSARHGRHKAGGHDRSLCRWRCDRHAAPTNSDRALPSQLAAIFRVARPEMWSRAIAVRSGPITDGTNHIAPRLGVFAHAGKDGPMGNLSPLKPCGGDRETGSLGATLCPAGIQSGSAGNLSGSLWSVSGRVFAERLIPVGPWSGAANIRVSKHANRSRCSASVAGWPFPATSNHTGVTCYAL